MEVASTQARSSARGYSRRVGEASAVPGMRFLPGPVRKLVLPESQHSCARQQMLCIAHFLPQTWWALLRLSLLGKETLVSIFAKPAAGICCNTPEPSLEIPDFLFCRDSSQLNLHLSPVGRPFVFVCKSLQPLVTSMGFLVCPVVFFKSRSFILNVILAFNLSLKV